MHVLYILMRNDLDSMNPGKAMAQANHAYGALKQRVRSHLPMQPAYLAWMDQTPQEFGTTIVLTAHPRQVNDVLARADRFFKKEVIAGWVHDPTYPIKDGRRTHLIPLDTCGFVFCTKEHGEDLLSHLELHP